MLWTAVVPLKLNEASKSRLATVLSGAARQKLVEAMAQHVLSVLLDVPLVARVVLLASARPGWWAGEWAWDRSTSLNGALSEWLGGDGERPLLIVHADLPYLTKSDVLALIEAAESAGSAMATDIHKTGTNALAIAHDRAFRFQFGLGSATRHLKSPGGMALIDLPGLAQDIDTPTDLAELTKSEDFERKWLMLSV